MPNRLPTFIASHPVHGECICDDFAFAHRLERDERWSKAGDVAPVEKVEVQSATLQDLVDDRSLPHLAEMGIDTTEDFIAAMEVDRRALMSVPYITRRTLEKVTEAIG